MFFKFSILLLFIILAGNTVLGDSEDENEPNQTEDMILKDLYDDCRRWIGGSLDTEVPSAGFWMYMGKNNSDLKIMLDYYKNNPNIPHDHLELKDFSELFKYICSQRGVTVKFWATDRKTKAALRTLDQTACLRPEQTEDNILKGCDDEATTSYNPTGKTEEEILKDSFDDCRIWLNEPLDANIGLSGFCCYMGLNESDTVLDDFFKNNPHAFDRMSKNYDKNPGLIQGPIDFTLYCGLFRHICKKNNVSVGKMAKDRKCKASTRSLIKFMSLPKGKRD